MQETKCKTCKNCGCNSHCNKICKRKEEHYSVDGGKPYQIDVCKNCRCEDCQ